MMCSDIDSQSRLPVTAAFMAFKCKRPVCHAIYFGQHPTPPVLARDGLGLFRGREFSAIAEQINSWQVHVAIAAHRFAEGASLRSQTCFLHHVAGEGDAIGAAPVAEEIDKRGYEPCANFSNISRDLEIAP
jgi:hypothetical protein